jgi:TPR repeat protein
MHKWLIVGMMVWAFGAKAQSVQALRDSAKAGKPEAMMDLYERFSFGMGIEKSEDSAQFYLKQAANSQFPEALFLMGLEQTREIYNAKQFAAGVANLKKAGELQHGDALLKLSEIYRKNGTGTESDKYYSLTQSFEYAKKAADAGNVEALVYCGNSLLEAKGIKRNDSLAVVYLHRAADEHKIPDAQIKLADLYLEGTRIGGRDLNKSLSYYRAGKDNPRASLAHITDGTVGIMQVDQVYKRTQNLMFQSTGMVPQGMFTYPVSDK